MKTVIYTGPFDAVNSEGFLFRKGEPVEVPEALANSLLKQDFTTHVPAKETK